MQSTRRNFMHSFTRCSLASCQCFPQPTMCLLLPQTVTNLCYLSQTEWRFYGPKCALRLVFIRRVSAHDFLRTWFIGSKRLIKSDHLVEGTSDADPRACPVEGRELRGPAGGGGGDVIPWDAPADGWRLTARLAPLAADDARPFAVT